jgi:hypothetical protein
MIDYEKRLQDFLGELKDNFTQNKDKINETYDFFKLLMAGCDASEMPDSLVNGLAKCLQLLNELDDKYCDKTLKVIQSLTGKAAIKEDKTLKDILSEIEEQEKMEKENE